MPAAGRRPPSSADLAASRSRGLRRPRLPFLFEEEAKEFFDWVPKFFRPYKPGSLRWNADYAKALESAKEKKSLVWAFFYSEGDDESQLAESLECDLLRDPEVEKFAEPYVCVKIDRDKDEIAKELKIAKPVVAILDSDGKVLKKFERALLPRQFIASVKKLR